MHRIPFLPSTHFLKNCSPTAAAPFQGCCSLHDGADTQIYKQFHLFSSSVKPSLTDPRGGQRVSHNHHGTFTALKSGLRQTNWSFDVPVFQLAKSMCFDNTGSRMEEQSPPPAHEPDTSCARARIQLQVLLRPSRLCNLPAKALLNPKGSCQDYSYP